MFLFNLDVLYGKGVRTLQENKNLQSNIRSYEEIISLNCCRRVREAAKEIFAEGLSCLELS